MGYDECECVLCYIALGINNGGFKAEVCAECVGKKIEDQDQSEFGRVAGVLAEQGIMLGAFECDSCGQQRNVGFYARLCSSHWYNTQHFIFSRSEDKKCIFSWDNDGQQLLHDIRIDLPAEDLRLQIIDATRKISPNARRILITFHNYHEEKDFMFEP